MKSRYVVIASWGTCMCISVVIAPNFNLCRLHIQLTPQAVLHWWAQRPVHFRFQISRRSLHVLFHSSDYWDSWCFISECSKLIRVVLFSLLCVSSLSARMKEARGAGTSHISILWVFVKILQCLELSRAKHCPVYAVELSNKLINYQRGVRPTQMQPLLDEINYRYYNGLSGSIYGPLLELLRLKE